jgi:hypothetical protein
VGPRAVLDAVVKRKIPNPHRESNPRTPIVQPVSPALYSSQLPPDFFFKFAINYTVIISSHCGLFMTQRETRVYNQPLVFI